MSSVEHFFIERPTTGSARQMSSRYILREIQNRQMPLVQIFWINAFEHVFAFQIPIVREWLDTLVKTSKKNTPIGSDVFHSFDANSAHWYIYRKPKGVLFGPMSWKEILVMNKKELFENTDFCFSLIERNFLTIKDIPEIHIAPKDNEQSFFFQRRHRRFNNLATERLTIFSDTIAYNAQIADMSEQGLAIFCQHKMSLGDEIEVKITSVDEVTKIEYQFSHKGKIKNITELPNGYRYGLLLAERTNNTLKRINKKKIAA